MAAVNDESGDGKTLKDLGESPLAVYEESRAFAFSKDLIFEVMEFALQGLVGNLF
jgi:hypothetical protein